VLRQVSHEAPTRPKALVTDVPAALEAVCLKALAKEPAGRYSSAKELAGDVQRWLADEPVTAYPEPWVVRGRRWASGHRTLVTTVTAIVVMAIASLAVATFLLKSANEREQRSRARAETNFQLARGAVDRYFTKVSDSPQLHAHGLETLRAGLLEQAKEFYEQFLRDQPNEPGVRQEMSRARMRLAKIDQSLGRYGEAEGQYGQALEACQALHLEQLNNPAILESLADSHSGLAEVFRDTNQWKKAEDAYEQALSLREALFQSHADVPEYQHGLAAVHEGLGFVYQQSGSRKALAEKAYQRALVLNQALALDPAALPAKRRSVANTYNLLGAVHEDMGKLTEAAADFEQARDVFQELAGKHPDEPDYQYGLASAFTGAAIAHTNLGQRTRSEEEFKQAMSVYEKLARAHPAVLNYALDLALAYGNLGLRFREERRLDAASELHSKAIATCQVILAVEPRHGYACDCFNTTTAAKPVS
jgi:eukaryotic-like serine/threonine-protein kinase